MREVISNIYKRTTLGFMSAVLALSTLTPLANAQTASAATDTSGLFTVDTVCVNEKAELNLKLKQSGFLTGNILYETPYGNNGSHSLDFGDTDVWAGVKTNQVDAPSVSVSAKVGFWLFGHFVTLKTYTLATDAKNCDTTGPTATVGYVASTPTNTSVVATITANEDIQVPAGWTAVNSKTVQKSYAANTTENVTIMDLAGNASVVNIHIYWIDTVKPGVTLTNPQDHVKSNYKFVIDATDGQGLKRITGNIYEACNPRGALLGSTSSTVSGLSASHTVNLPATLGEGTYGLVYNAQDTANNTSNTKCFEFTIDNTGPSITEKNPANNQTISGTHKVSVKVTDPAGIKSGSVYARFKNAAGQEFTYYLQQEGSTDVYSLDVDTTQFVPVGTSLTLDRVSYRAVDEAGNPRYSISSNVTIDNKAPDAPVITSPLDGKYFNSTPILNKWTAVTDQSGIDHYQVAYIYDDGHKFNDGGLCDGIFIDGKAVSGCRNLDGTQRNHTPSTNEQGGVTIYVRAIDGVGNVSAWSSPVHYYYDNTAPSAPQFTSPTNYQWFNTKPTNKWDAVSDPSGIDYYQLKYIYDDGHTFDGTLCDGVKACREVPGNQTSRLHDLGTDEEGLVRVWIRAVDKAGNVSPWSAPVYYYYDHTAPVINVSNIHDGDVINTGSDNKLVIEGEFTDNMRANYANIQLVRTGYSSLQTIYGQHPAGSTLATFDNVVPGHYTLTLTATDLSHHVVKKQISFTVDNTATVTGDYFAAKAGGLNVGFHVTNLNNNAEKVEVAIYDENDNLITRNIGDSQQMIDLLNSNPDEISSPFWIPSQGDTDGWWTFGNPDWKNVSKPSYAVVTVYYGGSEPAESDKIPFISPSEGGFTWEELIAQLPADSSEESDPAGSDDQNSESSGQGTTGTPNDGNQGQNNGGNVGGTTGTDGQTSDEGETSEDEDVAGASTEDNGEGEESGEDILGTSTSDKDGTWNILGLAWYWWLLILAAVAAILRALYRRFATQEN